MPEISTKPYLLRALYEWCTDSGYTPYIAVLVDAGTRVPREYVKDGEIVLNISYTATSGLKMDNDFIRFNARFGGVPRDIEVPIANVAAIYARENGQGMAFDVTKAAPEDESAADLGPEAAPASGPALAAVPPSGSEPPVTDADPSTDPEPPKKGGRPTLTRVK